MLGLLGRDACVVLSNNAADGVLRAGRRMLRPGGLLHRPCELSEVHHGSSMAVSERIERTAPRVRRLLGDFAFDRMDRVFLAAERAAYPVVSLETAVPAMQ